MSLFGNNQGAQKSLFGGAPTSGSTDNKPASGGLFGQTATNNSTGSGGSLFGGGQAQAKPATGGMFGSSNQPKPTTPASGGSLFGGGAATDKPKDAIPATGGLFGQAKKPTAFGEASTAQPSTGFGGGAATAKPAATNSFGQAATATGFGGGATNTSTSPMFKPSTNTASAATALAPSGGLFGQAKPAATQEQAKPTPATGGLFGSQASASTTAQPATTTKPASNNLFVPTSSQPATTNQPQTTAAPASGLFGQAKKPEEQKQPTQPAAATSKLSFGTDANKSPATATSSVFGQKQEGNAQPTMFKAPVKTAQESNFGQQKPQGEQIQTGSVVKAPGDEQKQVQAAQDPVKIEEARKATVQQAKQQEFLKKPLEHVSKKWIDQIKRNEADFNVCVGQLQDYEMALIRSLADIEQIENQSVQIRDTYKDNLRDLNEVAVTQTGLQDELKIIEEELDNLIKGQSHSSNQHITHLFRDPSMLKQMPDREKVFHQSLKLQDDTQRLSRELSGIQETISNNEKRYTEGSYAFDYAVGKEGQSSNMGTHMKDIDRTLSLFYDSLKWIESQATHLDYQVNDIQDSIDRSAMEHQKQISLQQQQYHY